MRVTVLATKAPEKTQKCHLPIRRKASQLLCQTILPATQATDFHNWLLWFLVKSIKVSWYVIVSGGFKRGVRRARPPYS